MREIKFRAWYKQDKKMYPVRAIDFYPVSGLPHSAVLISSWGIVADQLVLMQYTGLKDKHEVDIFEGDILGLDDPNDPSRSIVEYIHDGFKTRPVGGMIYGTDWHDWIVIGNIYEHPHLLELPQHNLLK